MFTAPTQRWFDTTFAAATEVQRRGWPLLARGDHALLVAPTGSGKTLAAFLAAIDRLGRLPVDAPPGVRVLYVSPLKALVYDIERNLRAPLAGIRDTAQRLGSPFRDLQVDVRTGDTPQTERRRMARQPGEILVTTPESLYLLLGSLARGILTRVETVIVDEIHALAPTKRGSHLALSLERLATLAARDPQRIGLSATVRPLDEVARFLGGARPVQIVDASARPALELEIRVPVPDMERPDPGARARRGAGGDVPAARAAVADSLSERGIWPAIYPQLVAQIRAHRSTIVFVNSRGLAERLAHKLNELAGEALVRAHHGSLSHEKRGEIEEALKAGRLRAIVATSSLELGIDMGAVDLVVLVESPGSVARGLQRVGRAGHGVGETSIGRIYPKFRGDLLECAVVAERMLQGEIEALRVPRNALDVLAQQLVATVAEREYGVDELARLIGRAYPYRDLSREALEAVLDMLSGRYPSGDFADLRPLLAWDRSTDRLHARRGAALAARINAGTIPDRGNFAVHLAGDGPRIGELDEEMVFETRAGDRVLLGASTWRVEEIGRDRLIVSPAPGEPGRLPFWRGDGPGRPIELGRALGAFVRELAAQPAQTARAWLRARTPLDEPAAGNLLGYVTEQRQHTGAVPSDRTIVVERFRDEVGDWRVCILTPFGARVHAPWAMALQASLGAASGIAVELMYGDDGIVLRFADNDDTPDVGALLPDADRVEELVTEQLAQTALYASLFRENAARSLLLRRRGPGRRTPLWAQRRKAQNLLATVRQYPSFPLVLETYRQALSDVFDLPALKGVLGAIRSRDIHVHAVETPSASPFARSLVFAYVAAYLYEQDAPLAERRAQALTLDRGLLAELLGQEALRELIDADVLAELERELQQHEPERAARDADELHDMLRRLGDLSGEEIAARCTFDSRDGLAVLQRQRRAIEVEVAGARRWAAAEDAALYRDALGCELPPGLPAADLAPAEQPLEKLLRRFARTHGPFGSAQVARRFGLPSAQIEPALRALERDGRLVCGEIRPGGSLLDWCDADVLRRLRRRTLAKLRNAVAAVDGRTFASFLPRWHGHGSERGGPDRLLEVIGQLEGMPLSWQLLSGALLPARVAGFRIDMLDTLAAGGQIVWIGAGALGARDGRVALYRREHARQLIDPPAGSPGAAVQQAILEHLVSRGASFLVELEDGVQGRIAGLTAEAFRTALWELVWAGQITNDTFAPLAALSSGGNRSRRRRTTQRVAGGRWSRVGGLTAELAPTERLLCRARVLLERYGIVSREAGQAESLPGGYAAVYGVLKQMEEAGQVRRGYFVEGLSGAQFAHAGAIDRLRASQPADEGPLREAEILILAAADPANPYGALLPWPAAGGAAAPRRVAGAWLLLGRGKPLLYASPAARQLVSFPAVLDPDLDELAAALAALRRLPRGARRGALVIEKVDGRPVGESALKPLLERAGFVHDYRGMASVGR